MQTQTVGSIACIREAKRLIPTFLPILIGVYVHAYTAILVKPHIAGTYIDQTAQTDIKKKKKKETEKRPENLLGYSNEGLGGRHPESNSRFYLLDSGPV